MKIFTVPTEDQSNDLTAYEFLSLCSVIDIDYDIKKIDEEIDFDSLPADEIFKYCKYLHLGKRFFQKAINNGLLKGLSSGQIFLMSVESGSIFHVKDTFHVDLSAYLDEGLLLAARYGHLDVIKYLIKKGANINATNNVGGILINSIYHPDVIRFLTSFGADPNSDNTILTAIGLGLSDVVLILVENGADVNLQDKHGATPLLVAFYCKNYDLMEYLINKGANVNTTNYQNGNSLLSFASKSGDLESVILLVNNKINIDHLNNDGVSALIFAINNNHHDVANYLIECLISQK